MQLTYHYLNQCSLVIDETHDMIFSKTFRGQQHPRPADINETQKNVWNVQKSAKYNHFI